MEWGNSHRGSDQTCKETVQHVLGTDSPFHSTSLDHREGTSVELMYIFRLWLTVQRRDPKSKIIETDSSKTIFSKLVKTNLL
jgi:hypothetical protein